MNEIPSSTEEAVELFLARRQRGEAVDAKTFAALHPQLAPELEGALESLIALECAKLGLGAGQLPERIGLFRVIRELGRGGMGVVLEAVEESLHRRVALKVLPPELLSSPAARARFRREAELAARLDHPGIATIYGAGVEHDRPWIAMRFVEGRTLARVIADSSRDAQRDSREDASLLAKVARALHSAHEQGVVHRDIKPSNIIVSPDGSPVLLDFGLAIAVESDGGSLTRTGDAPGTPPYLPPEIVSGELSRPDVQSDLYALGVTLHECLALRRPFDAPTPAALYHAILAGAPADLRTLNRSVSRDLAVVTATAMERDRNRRYRSALALAEDLEACVAGRPIAARPVPLHGRVLRWVRREPRLALAISAAIVIAIGGLAWVSIVQTAAGRVVAKKNEELSASNVSLAEAKAKAETDERVATQKADDVLSLSAVQDLQDLVDRAETLWPADPEHIAEYEEWLRDARALLEGRSADPARGIKAKPGLAEHTRKLAEIEARAQPRSEEHAPQSAADARANEIVSQRAKLEWMSRMLGKLPWPNEADVQAELAQVSPPSDGQGWNGVAWSFLVPDPDATGPDADVHGGESKALLLARRAVEGATPIDRPACRDTLAWALFENARFEEALAEERKAVDEVAAERRAEYQGYLKKLESQVARWSAPEHRAERERDLAEVSSDVDRLQAGISTRREWIFSDSDDRWWHVQLAKLITDLQAFSDPKTGLCSSGISREHGWGIERRLEFARTSAEQSVGGPEASVRWAEAIASIRDPSQCPSYQGFVLGPQLGLLPIGRDRDSGLWEFAHLETGEPAERGADGKLVVTESMGLVFVLIPGGKFWMGAQRTDPTGRNYDPQARGSESPVHEVELSPHFVSKYEMTQAQWLRFVGRNPSYYGPNSKFNGHQHDLRHPVENVSAMDCRVILGRLGLSLPSEAQWENDCRGGTSTPRWTGEERESLRGNVNVADMAFVHAGGLKSIADEWPDLDDGWGVHAPVGTFAPNPFGLWEVLGNVWEWCQDSEHRRRRLARRQLQRCAFTRAFGAPEQLWSRRARPLLRAPPGQERREVSTDSEPSKR